MPVFPGIPQTRFHSKKKEKAAQLAAQGGRTVREMAAEIGIAERTMYKWLAAPEMKARIAAIVKEYGARVLGGALASKAKRVEKLQELSGKLDTIMSERAAHPLLASLPGGKTGLTLVRDFKKVTEQRRKIDPTTGAFVEPPEWERVTRMIPILVTDTSLVAEQRALIEQIGAVLGQDIKHIRFDVDFIRGLTAAQVEQIFQVIGGGWVEGLDDQELDALREVVGLPAECGPIISGDVQS